MRVLASQLRLRVISGGGNMHREYDWRDEPFGFYLAFLAAAISFAALVFCVVYVVTLDISSPSLIGAT